MTQFELDLDQVIQDIRTILIDKNNKYGDSALNPIQVFSKLDPLEAIKIRMDDKLSRIKNNLDGDTEDPMFDLLGYLLLYRVGELRKDRPKVSSTQYFCGIDPALSSGDVTVYKKVARCTG